MIPAPPEIVPDKEKLIRYLAYQARVSKMDKAAVHRALVSSVPGAEEKPARTLRIPSPNGGHMEFHLGDKDTPAPVPSDALHAARDRIEAAIIGGDGKLKPDFADIIRGLAI